MEEDIGVQKIKFCTKANHMKTSFKPETLSKYRNNGGVAPTNQ